MQKDSYHGRYTFYFTFTVYESHQLLLGINHEPGRVWLIYSTSRTFWLMQIFNKKVAIRFAKIDSVLSIFDIEYLSIYEIIS